MLPGTPGAQAEHLPGNVQSALAAADGTLKQRAGVLNNLFFGLKAAPFYHEAHTIRFSEKTTELFCQVWWGNGSMHD